jgi:tetratricopeptide (TPR) repeat protein
MTLRVFRVTVLLLGAVAAYASVPPDQGRRPQQILHFHPDDSYTRVAFDAFYNQEYDKAIHQFELSLQAHPDDPFAVNHLLSGVMFKEMYRIGALDSELYAKEQFLASKQFPMDPKVKARIDELTQRALSLEEARLKTNPDDADALYARGVTRGLHATYLALIEKAWFSGLRSAVGARHDHERVLELQPNNTDAKMIVGMHNYVVGSLSWPAKVGASMVGLSGSRSKGIEYLYESANGGGENSIDAKIALAIFLRREQRYPEAIKVVSSMADAYPKNFLMALELANLYNASGQAQQAIASYRKIIAGTQAGSFPDAHIEMAWYGLAESLRGQHDFQGAADAYDHVLQFQRTDPDLRLRTTLGAAEMYDAMNKRPEAVKRYQEVIAADSDSPRAEIAKKYLKDPYRVQ